jgi:hypothetical protein
VLEYSFDGAEEKLTIIDAPGTYLDDCNVVEPARHATDERAAERHWKLSEGLVGEKFGF